MINVIHVELETVCGPTSVLPENSLPEYAFAGRSNVGKSSLINCLMQRKSLARTSSKPGKTVTINFYRIEAKASQNAAQKEPSAEAAVSSLYLVDLPGYGYAKRSREQSAQWGEMIERYLSKSKQLKKIFILADCRIPVQESDLQMLHYARYYNIPRIIVATKTDKLKKNELAKQTAVLKQGFGLTEEERFVLFSAATKQGLDELYSCLQ